MGRTDMADWRTVQLFLSSKQPAVYEVQIDLEYHDSKCTCPTFKARKLCRHTKFVDARIESNDGQYPLMVHERAEDENIDEVTSTPEEFRKFVVKYGKIEVL